MNSPLSRAFGSMMSAMEDREAHSCFALWQEVSGCSFEMEGMGKAVLTDQYLLEGEFVVYSS